MKHKKRFLPVAMIVIGVFVIVVLMIWLYNNVSRYFENPKIYTAEKYEKISQRLRDKFVDIGIYDSLPPTSIDINLFADEWLEAVYFITFRTSDESYWPFAEKYARKNRDEFSIGKVRTRHIIIIEGPQTYGFSQEKFSWNIADLKSAKYFERESCFIVVNEHKKAVYMCLWQPSGGKIDL